MEESYETFEEELGKSKPEPPSQKPVQQKRRPEMNVTRMVRENDKSCMALQGETSPAPQQPKQGPTTLLRQPRISRTSPLQKSLTTETVSQTDIPWENVTLNRCLFVAITILVLTSGLQRLHESLRGHGTVEEENELTVRRSGSLRNRPRLPQQDTLWEVLFWWLPDLGDDDEEDEEDAEDDEDDVRQGKPKMSSSIRSRPHLDKRLTKERGSKLKERRAKKAKGEVMESKEKRAISSKHEAAADEEDENEENEEMALLKRKTPKG